MDLFNEFVRTLSAFNVLGPNDPVVIGVSGGPDSLALLHLFVRARGTLGVAPHVVHLNHRIRGQEADIDAEFVAAMAAEWQVPCRVEQMDVPALANERRLSLEEAARQARYTALGRAAAQIGARVVAVAHNADDQAETVLMHLLRGAGLVGLRGMLPITRLNDYHLLVPLDATVLLIRPLLEVPRSDIEAYCIAHNLSPRFDRSNLDTTYFRNRLRHEIIPHLEEINPNVRVILTRTASVISAYYDVLRPQIDAVWKATVREANAERISFDLAGWRALPLALQRALIRRATRRLRLTLRDVTYQHVEDAVSIAQRGETGAQATLPGGLVLRVTYDEIVIAPVDHRPTAPDWPLIAPGSSIEISGPGEHVLPGSAWDFSLQVYDGPRSGSAWQALLSGPWTSPINADVIKQPLVLRTRRSGDRFFPLGLGGTQKVSAFMINQKIPLEWRDQVPLLVAGDQVAWVCGWRIDERFAVRDDTQTVWVASFEQIKSG